jgi:hypothetical protein
MKLYSILIVLLLLVTATGCRKKVLTFHLTSINRVNEIDTIQAYPGKKIYFLGLLRNRALGHFTYDLAIIKYKGDNSGQLICYEMENGKKRFRVTNHHVILLDEQSLDTIGKWDKLHILQCIDSASLLKQPPKTLNFTL